MKLKYFFMTLFTVGIFVVACNNDEDDPAPVACFTIEHPIVAAGETAHFTSCAENAHHFEWNFGDAATSSNENPTHIYNTAGTYIVAQHVFNADMSKSDMTTDTITVN
jgi:PKD repeat protein